MRAVRAFTILECDPKNKQTSKLGCLRIECKEFCYGRSHGLSGVMIKLEKPKSISKLKFGLFGLKKKKDQKEEEYDTQFGKQYDGKGYGSIIIKCDVYNCNYKDNNHIDPSGIDLSSDNGGGVIFILAKQINIDDINGCILKTNSKTGKKDEKPGYIYIYTDTPKDKLPDFNHDNIKPYPIFGTYEQGLKIYNQKYKKDKNESNSVNNDDDDVKIDVNTDDIQGQTNNMNL